MASFGTNFASFITSWPNIPAVLMDGLYIGAAAAAAFVMADETAQMIQDRRKKFRESIEKNARRNQETITDFKAMDAETSLHNAAQQQKVAKKKEETAGALKPLREQEAESLSREEIQLDEIRAKTATTQEKTKAEIGVLRKKEQGEIQKTQARGKQEIYRAQQDTQHALQQQATQHRIALFSNLQQHLDTMTTLTTELKNTTEKATTSAERYHSAAEETNTAIGKLNAAMDKVIQTDLKLQAALADYDDLVAKGEDSLQQAEILRDALREAAHSETELQTTIEKTKIEHRSEINKAFMQDVAAKNQQLDAQIATCSHQTLDKLSELTQKEIQKTQEKMSGLTELKDISTCQEHLNKLLNFQSRIDVISLERSQEEQGQLSVKSNF